MLDYGPRILIADDDADVREGAAELLRGAGMQVVQAGDGEEAIVLVRRSIECGLPLHLALMDVHMPPPSEDTNARGRSFLSSLGGGGGRMRHRKRILCHTQT